MPVPVILGAAARAAGGALARKAAVGAGLSSEGSIAAAGRMGQFVGGAMFNTAARRHEEREEERRSGNPPGSTGR